MKARQARIEAQLKEAKELREEAERLRRQYEARLASVEEERRRLFDEVKRAVEAERERMLAEAKREVEERRKMWLEALEEEKEQLWQQLEEHLTRQLLTLSRRAFEELAGLRLEEVMVTAFLERLLQLSSDERALLKKTESFQLRTAFPLEAHLRQRIEEALRPLNPKAPISFETVPELICGIELEAGGYLWSWHLKGLLETLEEELKTWLNRQLAASKR